MKITIKDALAFLDPEDDSNWTADGMPRMDVVERLIDNKEIVRKEVTDADPEFCREVAHARREAAVVDEIVEADLAEEAEAEAEPTKLDLDQRIQNMDGVIASLEKAREALARERNRMQMEEYGGHTAADDTKARLAYIAKQREIRMERAGHRAEVLKHLNPTDLQKGSQLDAAMARKTGRGTQRPQRPPQ